MLWFFIGFIFGLYVAQESPTFPNVKQTFSRMGTFAYEIATNDKTFTATTKQQRSKSEWYYKEKNSYNIDEFYKWS